MTKAQRQQRRTGKIPIGKVVDYEWRPTDEQWRRLIDKYCPRFNVAMLAALAVEMHAIADDDAIGLTDRARLIRRAAEARRKYDSAVNDYSDPRKERKPLATAIEHEAEIGRKWRGALTSIMSRHLLKAQIIEGAEDDDPAPDVKPALEALDNIRNAARALVLACEANVAPRSKVFIRTKLEALFPRNLCASDCEKIRFHEWVDMTRHVAFYAPQNPDELLDGAPWSKTTVSRFWISDLVTFARKEELPTGAKTGLRANGEPSEFVKFVHELMKTIPSELRHGFVDDEDGDFSAACLNGDQNEPEAYGRIVKLIRRSKPAVEDEEREENDDPRIATWIEQARKHWREFLPSRCSRFEEAGILEQKLRQAAERTADDMSMFGRNGLAEHEAWKYVREEYLFLPPEQPPPETE